MLTTRDARPIKVNGPGENWERSPQAGQTIRSIIQSAHHTMLGRPSAETISLPLLQSTQLMKRPSRATVQNSKRVDVPSFLKL
jgi:hypothetical protein